MILYVISSRGILYEHGAHIVVLFYTQYLCLLFHKAEPFILTFLLNTVIVVNREEEGGLLYFPVHKPILSILLYTVIVVNRVEEGAALLSSA